MNNPDVSVVIAVKNEAIYVRSAVTSVLEQEGLNFEVIVVDDGSSDSTWSILTELQLAFPQLRLFKNPKAGKCSAFNYGVANAGGLFVCVYAGDDIMPAGSLAARFYKVKESAVDEPVVGLCKLITMSENKKFDGHLIPKRPGKGGLTGVSYMMSRPVVSKIFPVPESLPNEDTWMELAVTFFDWKIVHSDIVGCRWRVHSGNSINMLGDYESYNKKLIPRMAAIRMFYDMYGSELLPNAKEKLYQKVLCEEYRVKGDILGIMTAKTGFVNRLRALSTSNSFFYSLRKRLYGLLSGW
ncbi:MULTISPECIES: glycosyltransferase family 2 protein [Pseudomonas]|uniref:glycosyltransferase family 2 protein n=1 Tax=Pseudomonas TaxID=286 RepID=UPI001BEB37F3|nr:MULTISPECIES: glycosyltransferase family 2 protein [Pseudomonas]MBT2342225.1 glycosyltransferase family 2 protein [Pseudomonas fluorescens]MCD4529000.1 glycosyltransferase family 2 protein [Pseudomonas sp. C3-2018]